MIREESTEAEAAVLVRDMAKLRPRLRRLEKNNPHAVEALKYLDLALGEMSEIFDD